jgi:hypothetical protein
MISPYRIPKTTATAPATVSTTAISTAATTTLAITTTTERKASFFPHQQMMEGTKKITKRSKAGRDKHWARGKSLGYVKAAADQLQEEQLKAAQHQAAAACAAAQRSEQQRKWAVEAGTADFMAMMRMENELKETEDLALHAIESYERADGQRTELYYQAKSSNSLAAKTLMESLSGTGGETCKALAKQRKVQVVEQAKALRLTVKPHLTAAIQGHAPFSRPCERK